MPGNKQKKGPGSAGGNGSRASSIGNVNSTIAPPRPAGKLCFAWPKPDHPFFHQLRKDPDYVWRRMLASVCPGPEATKSC